MSFFRKAITIQKSMSSAFDRLLPDKFRLDGNKHFVETFAPRYLRNNMKIYDVGGGKSPFITLEQKQSMNLTVIGLDIDREELRRAPAGVYDDMICANIARYRGNADADLVICQAVLEHVEDISEAMRSIASILRPGGTALIFLPSRNAAYARINLILPERWKKKILYTMYPEARTSQGFVSHYDRCTPNHLHALAKANDLVIADAHYYYSSSYFTFFFPLHFVWRVWLLLFVFFAGRHAAETFSIALKKMPRRTDEVA